MTAIADILGPEGLLASGLEGFQYRPQQEAMAEAVADILEGGGTLICEAGTGTGKTFAYLVPALSSGRKVLVSTGTRNLQDQLFHRDIPLVRDVLKVPARVALLKGRGNYLCRYRLALALDDLQHDSGRAQGRRVRRQSGGLVAKGFHDAVDLDAWLALHLVGLGNGGAQLRVPVGGKVIR